MSVRTTRKDQAERLRVLAEHGYNVRAAARALGIGRATLQDAIATAVDDGLIDRTLIGDRTEPSALSYLEAKARMAAAFQRKQRKGNWRKPVMVTLPPEPFILKLFGDPHLDSSGCDFELFERHWLEMDAESGVYGLCVGDWFNNWKQSLAHLWRGEGDPSDAWLVFEHLMHERGEALLAACSGNHDDWTHGPADPVDLLMKRHGVVYRKGAVRIMLNFPGLQPIFVALRHKWKGHSMYSAAHSIVRSAIFGWRDHIMVGGHIHQDDYRPLAFEDGFKAHACQLSAFKRFDDFADVHGLMGPQISPVWTLVVDPRKGDADPDKVKVFWDAADARGHLAYLRGVRAAA